MGEDYYQLLGVPKSAEPDDIKKAYRRLALQLHPDKGGDAVQFQKVSTAYTVLADPEKRKVYDLHGEEGIRNMENGNDAAAAAAAAAAANPFNIFNHVFGGRSPFDFGGSGGGVFHQPKMQRCQEVELVLSLEEVFLGKVKTVDIRRRVIDQSKVVVCDVCRGQGFQVRVQQSGIPGLFQQQMMKCGDCSGVGKTVPCDAIRIVDEKLQIDIPPGCREGTRIVAPGKMDESPGEMPGDIVFVVRYKKHHPFFEVMEDGSLKLHLKINLLEALTGFQRIIKHLDGTFMRLGCKQVVRPNTVWIVNGEGIPCRGGQPGNLVVTFDIVFPDHISEDRYLSQLLNQKKTHQKLSDTSTAVVREAILQPSPNHSQQDCQQQTQHETHVTSECVQQ